ATPHSLPLELIEHIGEHGQPLLPHQTAHETDDHLFIANPERAPPVERALSGAKLPQIHAEGSLHEVRAEAASAELIGHRRGRHVDLGTAAIESPDESPGHRFETADVIVLQ